MEPNSYVVTFPMLMGVLVLLGGTVLAFFVKKWISDSEKADNEKSSAISASFKVLHERIDKLRDQREGDQQQIADLRVDVALAVKREEMTAMRQHMDQGFQEIIKAILKSGA